MTTVADPLALAPLESERFGLSVARATLGVEVDATAIVDWLAAHRVDIAILRVPAESGAVAESFRRQGLEPLHADSLVTWECDLQHYEPRAPGAGAPSLRVAAAEDAPDIVNLMHQVFDHYRNHYNANPLLDGARAVDGYIEWGLAHVGRDDRLCWLTHEDGAVSGLACSSHDPATGICVGNLHGVSPAHGGRGIYTELIRATQRHYRAAGYRRLRISTQLGNLTVQRVWAREGFVFAQAEHTYHLNPLFGCASVGRRLVASTPPGESAIDGLWRAQRGTIAAGSAVEQTRIHMRTGADTHYATHYLQGQWPLRHGHRHVTLAVGESERILGWAVTDL